LPGPHFFFRAVVALGISLVAVAAFAGASIAGFEIATQERITPGVTVLGAPLGGLTRQEATQRLGAGVVALLDRSIELRLGERRWTTSPRALGLDVRADELAEAAFRVGREGSLEQQVLERVEALRYGSTPVLSQRADGKALDQLLAQIATQVDHPPADARLQLEADGTLVYAVSQTGLQLDQAASRERVARAVGDGSAAVDLVASPLPPAVATEQIEPAHQQLARILDPATPVTITAAEQTRVLQPTDLANLVSLSQPSAPGESASVQLRDDAVSALLSGLADSIDRDAQDARFGLNAGALTLLRPSRDGRALDQAAATEMLNARILGGERTVALPVVPVPPAITSDDAPRLGSPELIEQSSTSFVGAIPEKRHNIQLAAQRLNGVVVPPGATFSFNKEVGPTTLEAGFQWGFGITTAQGGVHTVPSVAGGICQVATTLFQPVFWAGYQVEERYWHLYWIPSYTSRDVVGLDATVDADSNLDFKWTNPTSDPVLIQAGADAEHVTFSLYGRKPAWTVDVEAPVISGRIPADPTPVVQAEPTLPWGRSLPIESAREGFQVLITRHVTPRDGGPARTLALKSIYQPSHTVTLVGTANAPDGASVAEAVERLRASQLSALAPPAPTEPRAPAPAPAPQPASYSTPNGPRSLTQIREELGRAGWGGGSDQDAVTTYNRLAGAAQPGAAGH
jgi:vancomycin resistance protein YoaR